MTWTPVGTPPPLGLRIVGSREVDGVPETATLVDNENYYVSEKQWKLDNGRRYSLGRYLYWDYLPNAPIPSFIGPWLRPDEIVLPNYPVYYVGRDGYVQISTQIQETIDTTAAGLIDAQWIVDDFQLPYYLSEFLYFAYLPVPA